jgi:acetyltransferase
MIIIQEAENSLDQALSRRAPLDAFFHPHRVAVIGASEEQGSVGRTLLWNLLKSPFDGAIYPVNPKHSRILGAECYPGIGQTPDKVDLAVIATPAATVPSVIADCGQAGVRAAVVISAGFKETGPSGAALEKAVLAEANKYDLRIIGPNCLGVMNPHTGLNATFAAEMARSGSVAFVSQSGALCTAILDWSQREMVGFSAFVSVGSMLDVGWGDLIQYLGDDPKTQSIIIYMESVGDARSFLSAAREVALSKPIIVIKPGRTEAAAHAAASHTGALTGSDEVLDAAFRRCGVLRVNTIAELFYASEALGKQPRPIGPRLAIVTNAGGPGVLATDALLARGGKLAQLSEKTMKELNEFLPPHWSQGNPVDILGDAPAERWEKAVAAVAADPNNDGLLVVLAPQGMTDPLAVAHKLENFAHLRGKPVLASWMGGPMVEPGERVLNIAGIPTFSFPDSAAEVFQSMWSYSQNLQSLYETPALVEEGPPDAPNSANAIIAHARERGRTLLTEAESKRVLAAYGIPVVETSVALTVEEAVAEATRIGYPVALKLHSETITHKTDVGGVHLNLKTADAVRDAWQAIQAGVPAADFLGVAVQPMIKLEGYELILGSSIDSQFGPVVLFGGGGQLVEIYKDHALALPPLNTTLARRLMEQTRIFTALGGVRGRKPVDIAELERILVRFSRLVAEQRWIKEIDINPLLASPSMTVALDARIVLHPPEMAEQDLPRLAIRPYPLQFVKPWVSENGTEVLIRPIRPEDEPMLARFHATLSERSVYLRYFHMMPLDTRIAHERLTRICFIDYDREIVLVAEREREILAVGRLTKAHHAKEAEFALLTSDKFQGHGLGTELLKRLLEIARLEGLKRVTADILGENRQMIEICRLLGFRLKHAMGEGVVKAELQIL